MTDEESRRRHVVEQCDKHDEIALLDDGYYYFWIKDRGAMSASELRIISDELDQRNKAWDEQVMQHMATSATVDDVASQEDPPSDQMEQKAYTELVKLRTVLWCAHQGAEHLSPDTPTSTALHILFSMADAALKRVEAS